MGNRAIGLGVCGKRINKDLPSHSHRPGEKKLGIRGSKKEKTSYAKWLATAFEIRVLWSASERRVHGGGLQISLDCDKILAVAGLPRALGEDERA